MEPASWKSEGGRRHSEESDRHRDTRRQTPWRFPVLKTEMEPVNSLLGATLSSSVSPAQGPLPAVGQVRSVLELWVCLEEKLLLSCLCPHPSFAPPPSLFLLVSETSHHPTFPPYPFRGPWAPGQLECCQWVGTAAQERSFTCPGLWPAGRSRLPSSWLFALE